jgi:CHAT domain-containing protein
LPDNALLLQYYVVRDDLLIWAITRQGVIHVHSTGVDGRRLTRDISAYHKACEAEEPVDDLANRLSSVLLSPIAGPIRDHPQIILVPYGQTHKLPFHALPVDGAPIGWTHTVSYLPSASTLQYLQGRSVPSLEGPVLAVGNPIKMSYVPPFRQEAKLMKQLPWAAKEATYVGRMFPGAKVLTGSDATKAIVQSNVTRYRILHFATHAYMSEDVPSLSAILLANGESLAVYELAGLKLDADLMVISACDSARGTATRGDDVLGMVRGLLSAGVRALVVSLWRVEDEATSLLMAEFYRELRTGKAVSAALQSAQTYLCSLTRGDVELAERRLAAEASDPAARAERRRAQQNGIYAHPRFWAPFIAIGQ